MTHRPAVAAMLLIALIFPLIAEAQSPQRPHNNDGRRASWTIYSVIVRHAPDFALEQTNRTEGGAELKFGRFRARAGLYEEKRYGNGSLTQPFKRTGFAVTFTVH